MCYIDLEPHLELSALDGVTEEIIDGICRLRPMNLGVVGTQEGLLDQSKCELLTSSRTIQHPPGYGYYEKLLHTSFHIDSAFNGFAMSIRKPTSFASKHLRSECSDTEYTPHFPRLLAFADTLPFSQYGRVHVYFNLPGMAGSPHRDWPHRVAFREHFIHFNPLRKPFYVLSKEGNKTYVETRASLFRGDDYHGVDASPRTRFSFRIDGIFRDDFARRAGVNRLWEKNSSPD